jgi:hypothetical protein
MPVTRFYGQAAGPPPSHKPAKIAVKGGLVTATRQRLFPPPRDNRRWSRYETTALRAIATSSSGLRSYDETAGAMA